MHDYEQRMLDYQSKTSLSVLNYCIREGLSETAKEVARWLSAVAFEFNPDLRDKACMTYAQKPYILEEYQKSTGGY